MKTTQNTMKAQLTNARQNYSFALSELRATYKYANNLEARVECNIEMYFEALDKLRTVEEGLNIRLTSPTGTGKITNERLYVKLSAKY